MSTPGYAVRLYGKMQPYHDAVLLLWDRIATM
jgi:hypothetical protein